MHKRLHGATSGDALLMLWTIDAGCFTFLRFSIFAFFFFCLGQKMLVRRADVRDRAAGRGKREKKYQEEVPREGKKMEDEEEEM